jgi:hypothetical protein
MKVWTINRREVPKLEVRIAFRKPSQQTDCTGILSIQFVDHHTDKHAALKCIMEVTK